MKLRTIVVTAAVAAVMVACSPSGSETPNPTPETPPSTTTEVITPKQSSTPTPSPSPTPTPSPSPTVIQSFPPPPAGETEEQAAIREGWMAYWKVYDKFTQDPYVTDFTETQLVTVSGSDQARIILDELQDIREHGWRIQGDHVLREYVVSTPPSVQGEIRSVIITYCYDGRNKRLVDAETGVEVQTTAADTYVETAWLEQGADNVWRVALIGNEAKPC